MTLPQLLPLLLFPRAVQHHRHHEAVACGKAGEKTTMHGFPREVEVGAVVVVDMTTPLVAYRLLIWRYVWAGPCVCHIPQLFLRHLILTNTGN